MDFNYDWQKCAANRRRNKFRYSGKIYVFNKPAASGIADIANFAPTQNLRFIWAAAFESFQNIY